MGGKVRAGDGWGFDQGDVGRDECRSVFRTCTGGEQVWLGRRGERLMVDIRRRMR